MKYTSFIVLSFFALGFYQCNKNTNSSPLPAPFVIQNNSLSDIWGEFVMEYNTRDFEQGTNLMRDSLVAASFFVNPNNDSLQQYMGFIFVNDLATFQSGKLYYTRNTDLAPTNLKWVMEGTRTFAHVSFTYDVNMPVYKGELEIEDTAYVSNGFDLKINAVGNFSGTAEIKITSGTTQLTKTVNTFPCIVHFTQTELTPFASGVPVIIAGGILDITFINESSVVLHNKRYAIRSKRYHEKYLYFK